MSKSRRAALIATAIASVLSPSHELRRKTDEEAYRIATVFLIESEGVELRPYIDTAGYRTVGIGHLWKVGDPVPGTVSEALNLLRDDINKHANCIEHLRDRLNDYQFAAILSYVFNIGCEKFNLPSNSVRLALEGGDFESIPRNLRKYNKRRDKKTGLLVVDVGLVNRREHEINLWKGNWSWDKYLNSSLRG